MFVLACFVLSLYFVLSVLVVVTLSYVGGGGGGFGPDVDDMLELPPLTFGHRLKPWEASPQLKQPAGRDGLKEGPACLE